MKLTLFNQWFSGERNTIVAVLLVSARRSLLGASTVSEDASIDSISTAVSTNVVDLVVATVVVVIVVVLVIVIQGTAFSKFIHVDFVLLLVVLGTVSQLLGDEALVDAVVLVVVGVVIGGSVGEFTILALVLTVVLGRCASLLVGSLLSFLPCFDKLLHINNVLSTTGTAAWPEVSVKSWSCGRHRYNLHELTLTCCCTCLWDTA